MAEYSVDYLKRLRAAIEDFEVAFEEWMDTPVEGLFAAECGHGLSPPAMRSMRSR